MGIEKNALSNKNLRGLSMHLLDLTQVFLARHENIFAQFSNRRILTFVQLSSGLAVIRLAVEYAIILSTLFFGSNYHIIYHFHIDECTKSYLPNLLIMRKSGCLKINPSQETPIIR